MRKEREKKSKEKIENREKGGYFLPLPHSLAPLYNIITTSFFPK